MSTGNNTPPPPSNSPNLLLRGSNNVPPTPQFVNIPNNKVLVDAAEYTRLLVLEAQVQSDKIKASQSPSSQLGQNQPLPAAWTPKIEVSPYDGNPVGPGPRDFLIKAEQLKEGKAIPERIFLDNWVPILLTGLALEWYRTQPRWRSWIEFRFALTHKFQMPNRNGMILERLYGRKQGEKELVDNYIKAMIVLINQLDNGMSESDQVRIVEMNLLEPIKLLMSTKCYTSLLELAMDAQKIESRLNKTNVKVESTVPVYPAPDQKPKNSKSNLTCYNCGKVGHKIAQCFLPRKNKNNPNVGAVLSESTGQTSKSENEVKTQ